MTPKPDAASTSSLLPGRPPRRRFLAAAAGASGVAGLFMPVHAQPVHPRSPAAAHPRDVGRKFNPDGSPMPFAGNTFLGHLAQQGSAYEGHDRWLDIVREMPRHAFAGKLTLVPTSSWHVTLIGGVNDVDRSTAIWPQDLARDMPIQEVHKLLLQRVQARRRATLGACSFRVVTDVPATRRHEGTLEIPLVPLDEATERRLRDHRDELAELMKLRRPDHDSYRYHVTIGYLWRWLDDLEATAMQEASTAWRHRLATHGPLTINAFHFCLLRDMFAYKEICAV